MKRLMTVSGLCVAMALAAMPASASTIFLFTETGGTVLMTSFGALDTTKLVPVSRIDGWGGTGTEHNGPGEVDIMGSSAGGSLSSQFAFNVGTDTSAVTNPGGPFAFSDFSVASVVGSTPFATYSGFDGGFGPRLAGIIVDPADIIGGLWTPDNVWTYSLGATFASLGLVPGIHTVADFVTGESITIQIGGDVAAVPEPATLLLVGGGLGLASIRRRLRKRA